MKHDDIIGKDSLPPQAPGALADLLRRIPVARQFAQLEGTLRAIVTFAYDHGFHEVGYDAVADMLEAARVQGAEAMARVAEAWKAAAFREKELLALATADVDEARRRSDMTHDWYEHQKERADTAEASVEQLVADVQAVSQDYTDALNLLQEAREFIAAIAEGRARNLNASKMRDRIDAALSGEKASKASPPSGGP